MKILIAEDDPVSRRLLEATLIKWGYEVVVTDDGAEAWEALQQADAPSVAILDWMMPHLDGVAICRKLRERENSAYTYILLLTAKGSKSDIAAGLEAGADDYVNKPFNQRELRARIKVGERMVELERALAGKITELETALSQVKELKGLLPICMYCKKIRDDNDYWHGIETYLHQHTGTDFSHGICPTCYEKWQEERRAKKGER